MNFRFKDGRFVTAPYNTQMGCKNCKDTNIFREKLGKCRACMIQLVVLSLVDWTAWYYLYSENPKSIETLVATLAGFAFTSLLALHILVWLFTGGKGLQPKTPQEAKNSK